MCAITILFHSSSCKSCPVWQSGLFLRQRGLKFGLNIVLLRLELGLGIVLLRLELRLGIVAEKRELSIKATSGQSQRGLPRTDVGSIITRKRSTFDFMHMYK